MLYYCKKCGRIINRNNHSEKICDCCHSVVYPVPEKYWLDGLDFLIENKNKPILREELVKPSPEFDQYLFDHREEILSQKNAEFNRAMAVINGAKAGKNNKPKCPTCQSTNIEKISDVKKAAGFLTVGVFSKNFGKTYHCKNCDYRW